ncbi:MAG: hypothetical protein QM487_10910 [Candidatus Marithrix sp.]
MRIQIMEINEKIRFIREMKGWSQKEMTGIIMYSSETQLQHKLEINKLKLNQQQK